MRIVNSRVVLLLVTVNAAFLYAQQYQYPFQNPNLPLEQRAANIISLMTLEEKIAALGSPAVPRLQIPAYGVAEGIHQVVLRGRGGMPGLGAIPQPGIVQGRGGPPPGEK